MNKPTQSEINRLWLPFSGSVQVLSRDIARGLKNTMPGLGVACGGVNIVSYRYIMREGLLPHEMRASLVASENACDPNLPIAFLFKRLRRLTTAEQVEQGTSDYYYKLDFSHYILTDGERWCPVIQDSAFHGYATTPIVTYRSSGRNYVDMLSGQDQVGIIESIRVFAEMQEQA